MSVDEFERFCAEDERAPSIAAALERLPSPQRDAVRARVVEERPYEEVAAVLKISEVNARKRVSRGARDATRRIGEGGLMSGYVEELERELMRAGAKYQRRRIRVRGWPVFRVQVSLGAVAMLASTCVTIAVALVAFGLLRGGQGGAGERAAVPAGARQLVSMLAVLRRPQTAADRSGSTAFAPIQESDGDRIVPSLTRLVASFAGARYSSSSPPRPARKRMARTRGGAPRWATRCASSRLALTAALSSQRRPRPPVCAIYRLISFAMADTHRIY